MSFIETLKKRKFLSTSLLVFSLSAAIVLGTAATAGVEAAKGGQSAAPDATPLVLPKATELPNEFTRLAKMVEPSVVHVITDFTPKATTSQRRGTGPESEEEQDQMDMFRRFFGGPGGPGGSGRGGRQMPLFKQHATGTGFIVDKNGYIMTNNHVVDKADHIKVKLPFDSTEYKAKLIGVDRETDMAVIKIDAGKPLPFLRPANSDGVQVGDWAVAIGSPFGLETSVTVGIISAKGRDIPGAHQFQRFLQTDAAINPGNSGGPLLNIKGEVIGINTAIATDSGGNQGIGFALPVNMAVRVYNSIIRDGRVTRGSIGIQFPKETKPELLRALGVTGGVVVSDVTEGGPAEKAGVKKEDIITAIDGSAIKDGDDLVARISETSVGETVKLSIDREGKKTEIAVRVQDRTEVFAGDPRIGRADQPEVFAEKGASQAKFGIAIVTLADAEKKRLDAESGVQVTRVETDSFAEEMGVQERDIILSINRQPVTSVDDVRKIQATIKPGDAVAFRVMRVNPATRNAEKPQTQSFYLSGTLPRQ